MLIVRNGLIEWLGAARVVLVRAHAGAGKSTFAEQVALHWAQPVVRLRGGRIDVAGIAEIAEILSRSTTLFIDDAELVADSAADAVVDLVDRSEIAGRILISGRSIDRFAVLGSRADARTVTAQQLSLTRDEIGELLDDAVPGDGGSVLRDDLFAATHGWPVLAAAAIERLREQPGWVPSGPSGVSALLRDLLDSLSAFSPSVSSIARLPLFDDVVSVRAGAAVDLGRLMPINRLGRWSVVPPWVAAQFDRSVPLAPALVGDVARRYVQFGETAAAAQLLLAESTTASAAVEVAVGILGAVHWSVLSELDIWRLRELVGLAERSRSVASAGFLVAIARAAEYKDRDLWNRCLDAAEERVATGSDVHRAVLADRARYTLRGGNVVVGRQLAESALRDISEGELATRGRALGVLAMADAFECTVESFASAARRYRTAAELFQQGQEWAWRADALARLGYTALHMAGYPVEGREAMEAALALLPVADRVRAFWLTNYADVLDFVGRSVDADAVIREAIEIGERLHDDAVLGMAWWTRTWLASHRGDAKAFHAAVAEVERHRGDWLHDGQEVEYLASTAEHHLLVGDVAGYRACIAKAELVGDRIGLHEPLDLARAWFDATDGDATRGRDELLRVEGTPAVVAVNRPRRLLLLAVAHLRLGDDELARSTAAAALDAAADMGVPDLHARQHGRLLELLAPVLTETGATPAPTMTLRMLGGFSVTGADGASRTPQPGHPATLVKLLALNGVTTADTVIDRLWPDADAATGRARLRNVLNRLKERSGRLIVRVGDTLMLADDVVVDVAEFEAAAADSFDASSEERVGRSRRAVSLYAGDLLPGDVYEDWSTGPRERLRRRFVALADAVADDAEARGDTDEAARLLDLALEIEPLDEVRTLRLCQLLDAVGRSMSAAAVARRCIQLLDELGLDPGAELARFAAIAA